MKQVLNVEGSEVQQSEVEWTKQRIVEWCEVKSSISYT